MGVERTGRQRLPSLTGLRFFLALPVLVSHLLVDVALFADADVHTALYPSQTLAACAVSGFFVLSGFVLAWTHRPGEPVRAFWRRRLWRIVPAHVLGWAGGVAFFALTSVSALPDGVPTDCGPRFGVISLLLLQGWTPGTALDACFNAPSWSISCEMFFYTLFPLLIAAARKIPAARLGACWAILAVAVLTLPLTALTVAAPALGRGIDVGRDSMWLCYFFPPMRLAEFALGIVTARLVAAGRWPRVPRALLLVLPVPAVGLAPLCPPPLRYGALAAIPLALVIAHLALADGRETPRPLARPAFVALGEASYALYIVHWPLLLAFRHLLGYERAFTIPTSLALAAAGAVLAQATALIVYRFVERPLNRRFARRPARTAPGPAGAIGGPAPEHTGPAA
ncbi:acyltransferase [Streptomyces sp. WAC 06725]|nr:acyltransferase [Streptomyces sp. WAC 06725]